MSTNIDYISDQVEKIATNMMTVQDTNEQKTLLLLQVFASAILNLQNQIQEQNDSIKDILTAIDNNTTPEVKALILKSYQDHDDQTTRTESNIIYHQISDLIEFQSKIVSGNQLRYACELGMSMN